MYHPFFPMMGFGAASTIFLVALILGILYLLSLQKAFERCAPENRAMPAGQVWLLLIPLFNLVWNFIVVTNLAKTLGAEFRRRGISAEAEPGKSTGLAMSILAGCSLFPVLNLLAGPAGFVVWIIYWVKIAGYSKLLETPGTTYTTTAMRS